MQVFICYDKAMSCFSEWDLGRNDSIQNKSDKRENDRSETWLLLPQNASSLAESYSPFPSLSLTIAECQDMEIIFPLVTSVSPESSGGRYCESFGVCHIIRWISNNLGLHFLNASGSHLTVWCPGFSWDRFNLFPSNWHSPVFWI